MNDELYHHGVRGMKWGKRNGPPYPLNEQGKSSLRKQRMASYGKSVTKGGDYSDNRISREEKKERKKQIKEAKRKIAFNDYSSQDKHKLVRNTAIGTILGGPVLGITVGLITDNSIRKGKAISSLHFNDKVSDVLNSSELGKTQNNIIDKTINGANKASIEKDVQKSMDILEKNKNTTKQQGWNEKTVKEYNTTRNSFNDDQRKDIWVDAFERANNPNLTDSQRAYAKAEAARIVDVDKRNKNYKSPNNNNYELLFLEAIQNKEILAFNDLKAIDAEYKKYKKDRDHYFEVEREKLRDY